MPEKWNATSLRRAVNALLPDDVWVAAAHDMRPEFHARFSALSRRYSYYVGTDDDARSPFRRRTEWALYQPVDRDALHAIATALVGNHRFVAFAARGSAPDPHDHRCIVTHACWSDRPGGLTFVIEANRFLHHMVRFLVGTSVAIATGRRPPDDLARLLAADTNDEISPPAPAHALFLDRVTYPRDLYLPDTSPANDHVAS